MQRTRIGGKKKGRNCWNDNLKLVHLSILNMTVAGSPSQSRTLQLLNTVTFSSWKISNCLCICFRRRIRLPQKKDSWAATFEKISTKAATIGSHWSRRSIWQDYYTQQRVEVEDLNNDIWLSRDGDHQQYVPLFSAPIKGAKYSVPNPHRISIETTPRGVCSRVILLSKLLFRIRSGVRALSCNASELD